MSADTAPMTPEADDSFTSGYIPVPGAELYCETHGQGHPLVLLHAGVGDLTMWDDVLPTLSARYRVVRFDQRGFGRSRVLSPVPYSFGEDVGMVLDALGIERAHLLGCSLGGQAAIDFALTYPSAVTALIAVAAGVGGFVDTTPTTVERVEEIDAAVTAGDLDRATELSLRLWLDGPLRQAREVPAALRARVGEMMRRTLALPEIARPERLDPPAAVRLDEIVAPALVLVGDRDVPEALRQSELIAMHVPFARKVVIPNTAHLLAMEVPDRFTHLVLDFLQTVVKV